MNLKKTVISTVMISIISMSGVFAFGIGLQIDGDPYGGGYGPALTFKLDTVPLVFAANIDITEKDFSFGLTGDWWIFNNTIEKSYPVKWFVGYGFFIHSGTGRAESLIAGARLPIGVNAFFNDGFIEPYIQVAPSVGIAFEPSFHFPEWYLPVSLGIRFWFD